MKIIFTLRIHVKIAYNSHKKTSSVASHEKNIMPPRFAY